jgi:hypothetical protein
VQQNVPRAAFNAQQRVLRAACNNVLRALESGEYFDVGESRTPPLRLKRDLGSKVMVDELGRRPVVARLGGTVRRRHFELEGFAFVGPADFTDEQLGFAFKKPDHVRLLGLAS